MGATARKDVRRRETRRRALRRADGHSVESYRVVDISADGILIGLRDGQGGKHLARLATPTLALNDEVFGSAARLGFQLLMSHNCTQFHRMTMLQVGCPRLFMLR